MVAETEFPVQLSLQAAITHRLDTDMGPGNIYALQARRAWQEWADGAQPMRVSRVMRKQILGQRLLRMNQIATGVEFRRYSDRCGQWVMPLPVSLFHLKRIASEAKWK